MDSIKLWRDEDGRARCSIDCPIRHHSPDGIEWGYNGSGPADLAINILHHFIVTPEEMLTVKMWDGSRISNLTERLHQRFKDDVIARVPDLGCTFPEAYLRGWIRGATEVLEDG